MILLVRHGESTWNAHTGARWLAWRLAGLWLRTVDGRLASAEGAGP